MPPVFKTGESRVSPGSGRFDSDTLPPMFSSIYRYSTECESIHFIGDSKLTVIKL